MIPPFTEELLLDAVEDVLVEQQLQQILRMAAVGMTTRAIWAHFARHGADPACKTCSLDDSSLSPAVRAEREAACEHGPPRWARPDGSPIPLRTMQRIVARVRERWREERAFDRMANRQKNLLTLDLIQQGALEAGQAGLALAALRLRAELDGSYVAAEEAVRPSLHERVVGLAARLVDFEFDPPEPRPVAGTPAEWRFRLLRLERLLLQCDESAARYRKIGEPPLKEAQRRQWFAKMNAEGAYQRATFPGVHPEKRFEDVNKGAFTGGMISDNTVVGELADTVDKLTAAMRKDDQQ